MSSRPPHAERLASSLDAADALVFELEAQCELWMRPHVERIRRGQPLRPKIINDALWGAIHLHPWEVALFDSELVQRLRYIRQLGVVHWVYPTASHSRLEHSLGTLHQMGEFVARLTQNTEQNELTISDLDAKLLRIAALVHDSGHCAMSHVPEPFINQIPGVEELASRLEREHGARARPSASEAFAAVFVRSPAFKALLGVPQVGATFILDVDEATRRIATLLLGGAPAPGEPFLSLLLSGPFDADKLDYMPRDCLMAGVRCAVDAKRVIEQVRLVDVPGSLMREHAPRSRVEWDRHMRGERLQTPVLGKTGAEALAEIATTRGTLYDKVYFHHKVRAAEMMARRALLRLGPLSATEWLRLADDDLLLDRKASHFKALRDRRLLKRALVVARPDSEDPREHEIWRRLIGELDQLRAAIHVEAIDIARRLALEGAETALAEEPLEVDLPPTNKIRLDPFAFLGGDSDAVSRPVQTGATDLPEATKRAEKQPVYVFAPEAALLAVFIAGKAVLADHFGLRIDAAVYGMANLDPNAIRVAEARLTTDGYYAGRSLPEPFVTADPIVIDG